MCCLFGLIDVKHQLSGYEKNRIISILAEASTARGVDATGYAYNSHGKLIIEKQPLPAYRMKFRIPKDAYVVMGHTRMTTQGDAQKNRNNHPFLGRVQDTPFALAHNGVLSNDDILRKNHCLPKTKIETDSYVAVQLIEKQNSLDLDSVRYMAELVKGTFNFTVLDRNNKLYIVKGNNPFCLYHFKKAGFYLYASTKPILEEALEEMGYQFLPHEEVKVSNGEILMIDAKGIVTREHFTPPVSSYSFSCCNYWEPIGTEPTGYRKYMMDYAATIGIPKKEMDWLHHAGYHIYDIEEAIFSSSYRAMLLMESGYYDEQEDELYEFDYDYFRGYAWT